MPITNTELAEVIAVNLDAWTCTVETKLSNTTIEDVKIGGDYCHVAGGAFSGYAPEEGALCYVMWSDDTPMDKIILRYIMPYSFAEKYRGGRPNKEEIQPGDAVIQTNTGSKIIVKNDDTIVITAATGASSRVYDGRAQAIFDTTDSYSLSTGGGSIEWRSKDMSPLPEGQSPVTFTLSAKKSKTDLLPLFQIEVGDIASDNTAILKASINPIASVFQNLGITLPSELLQGIFERTVSLLGESIEKCLTKKIEAQEIVLKESATTGVGAVKLGSESASSPVIKGDLFNTLFLTHTHTGVNGLTGGANVTEGQLAAIESFKVFVD